MQNVEIGVGGLWDINNLNFDINGNYASILYHFWVSTSQKSKVSDFNLPHLHMATLWGDLVRILYRPLATEN